MMSKGLAFAAIGAAIAAAVWVILITATGLNLWILAPIVGGAAGFGMMRGTQMRGGASAGVVAAALTLAAIFAARFIVIRTEVREFLTFDEAEIIDALAWEVADEWIDDGYEVYDEDEGDFLPAVHQEAEERWLAMSEAERGEYTTAITGETGEAAAVLTPLALLFDFGIFGTIIALLAAGCAFKTGSVTLEEALVERGHAADGEQAQSMATDLRAADTSFFARLGQSGEADGGAGRIGGANAAAPNRPDDAAAHGATRRSDAA